MEHKAGKHRYMTLRELRARTGSTRGMERPTRKKLMTMGTPLEIFTSEATPGYSIAAYSNGFALAVSNGRYTVVRIDECCGYIYTHLDFTSDAPEFLKPQDIAEEEFLDQPWPIRVMLTADDRFQANEDDRERHWISKHPEIPDDKNWMRGGYGSLEDEVIRKLMKEELLKTLTDKQREVFRLYHDEGYTQQEVAEILGIKRESVADRLKCIDKKLKKFNSENA